MRNKIKLAILIVYYKEKKELLKCIASINDANVKVKYEIVIVDNSNSKNIRKTLASYPLVKYIKAPGNIGYGRGMNLAAKHAAGEYIFTLNPDTKLLEGTIEKLLKILENKPGKAAVAPMIVNTKGTPFPFVGSHELTPIKGIYSLSFINKVFPKNSISRSYLISTKNKRKTYQAEVIPGVFMIKKKYFETIGGFDKNFFLYFEDTDLFKRFNDAGYSLYISPESKIIHIGQVATSKILKINEIFKKSRFYYFKKHFGVLSALSVEGFLRIDKWVVALGLILFIASFLRFYRLPQNLIFHGELGVDYLAVRDILMGKRTALLGPRTSHEWLSIAPLFYWIMAFLLPLFKFHPVIGAYFFAFIGVFGVYICYEVISKLLNKQLGLFVSYLVAISPAWVRLTRDSRFNAISALLFFPFLFFLIKSVKKDKHQARNVFWLGIIMGLSYNFFPSVIVWLPTVFIFFLINKKTVKLKILWKGILGLLIPLIPFLLYDFQHKFAMLTNLFLWGPYRIAGFFGLYPKNTASGNIIKSNFVTLYNFFWDSWFPVKNIAAPILFICVLTYFAFEIKKRLKVKKNNFWIALSVAFSVTLIALFLHGDPPQHYYLVIFPIPLILLSGFLVRMSKSKIGIIISTFIIVLVTFSSIYYYFSDRWFYLPKEKVKRGDLPVPYYLQEKVTAAIIEKASGREYALKRVGPLDYFEHDFAQNYNYLLWRAGNEPVEFSGLTYTIYEDTRDLPYGNIFWVGNIAILDQQE